MSYGPDEYMEATDILLDLFSGIEEELRQFEVSEIFTPSSTFTVCLNSDHSRDCMHKASLRVFYWPLTG